MIYTKPEVGIVGNAVQVIEQLNPPKISPSTDPSHTANPAYDLDE